jgi:hypothetical protein
LSWQLLTKHHYPEMSLTAVGALLGGLDHATISYALRQVEQRAEQNPAYRSLLTVLIGVYSGANRSRTNTASQPALDVARYMVTLVAAEIIAGRGVAPFAETLQKLGVQEDDCIRAAVMIGYVVDQTLRHARLDSRGSGAYRHEDTAVCCSGPAHI